MLAHYYTSSMTVVTLDSFKLVGSSEFHSELFALLWVTLISFLLVLGLPLDTSHAN